MTFVILPYIPGFAIILISSAAREYEEVKRRLAKQYPEDRIAYTDGKQQVIDKLLREAREWREKTNSFSKEGLL